MTEVEQIKAILAIKALKARYFRTIDEKDWAGHEAVFARDLMADFRSSADSEDESLLTHGASLHVAKLAPLLAHVVTVHHGHMPEITILSQNEATGIWAMEDKLWAQAGSSLPFSFMHGYGHYHERYICIDDEWKIQQIRLARLRVDIS